MYFLSWIALTHSNICFVCDCFFVELKTIEAEPEENVQIISFKYKVETLESYNANTTYDLVKKYFYVDCSSDNNVGQINNLKWPKLEILGVLANFKNSQWKKLEFFPDNVKKQMTTLSLSYNLISDVEPFELKEFAVLQMLNLSHNQIETIKKSTYSTLHSLKILDFTGNSINHIDDWAFYGTRLKYLNLARNSLTQLTSNTFRGLNDLSILDLSENRLVKLSEDFGNYLPSLKILTLRGNELKKLPVFPSELKKLDLNGNEFTQLLISHSNLEILDVSRNEISNLGEINIPSLKVI